jgi:hypothetical protein
MQAHLDMPPVTKENRRKVGRIRPSGNRKVELHRRMSKNVASFNQTDSRPGDRASNRSWGRMRRQFCGLLELEDEIYLAQGLF